MRIDLVYKLCAVIRNKRHSPGFRRGCGVIYQCGRVDYLLFRRRQPKRPAPRPPSVIMNQLAGSGTAATLAPGRPAARDWRGGRVVEHTQQSHVVVVDKAVVVEVAKCPGRFGDAWSIVVPRRSSRHRR